MCWALYVIFNEIEQVFGCNLLFLCTSRRKDSFTISIYFTSSETFILAPPLLLLNLVRLIRCIRKEFERGNCLIFSSENLLLHVYIVQHSVTFLEDEIGVFAENQLSFNSCVMFPLISVTLRIASFLEGSGCINGIFCHLRKA